MRLRSLALAVGLASAFSASMSNALGLGEIKLKSSLNQPLEAEIKLLQVRDLNENEILVSLASKDEFRRAGIDRLFLLTDLKFDVRLDGPAGPVISVTSRNPVREPYLNFLLESQWPNGRILREYTVLLDLPVFSDEPVKPVRDAAAVSRPASGRVDPAPAPPRAPRAPVSAPDSGSAQVYGPVSATDTLWDIALKVRPDRGYSVHKTMLALQRLNPEAFINGNINMLRRGQVLRIPRASEIDAVSQQQALNEVAYQNNQWTGDQAEEPAGAQLDATEARPPVVPVPGPALEGRLKVAGDESRPDTQMEGRGSGQAGAKSSAGTASLQNELATSLEELDKTRRENADLQQRLSSLEEQIRTMERLMEVTSQEMRTLQLQSGKAAAGAAGVEKSQDAVQASSAGQGSKSWIDTVTDNILYIGGALVAILAGVLLLLRRRDHEEEPELALAPVQAQPAAAAAAVGDADDAELDIGLLGGDAEAEDLLADELVLEQDETPAPVHTEPQTDDVVGEADIYIAYGKLDQAKAMLLKALEIDSDNTVARLKLMEVYAEDNDLSAFDQQYGLVAASGDAGAIARADDLRMHFEELPSGGVNLDEEHTGVNFAELEEPSAEQQLLADEELPGNEKLSSDDDFFADEDLFADEKSLTSEELIADEDLLRDEDLLADEGLAADLDPTAQQGDADSGISATAAESFTDEAFAEFLAGEQKPLAEAGDKDEYASDLGELSLDLQDEPLELVLDDGSEAQQHDDLDFDLDLDDENQPAEDSAALDSEEDTFDLDFNQDDIKQPEVDTSAEEDNAFALSDDTFAIDVESDDDDLHVAQLEGDLDFDLAEPDAEIEETPLTADASAEPLTYAASEDDFEIDFDEADEDAGFDLTLDGLEEEQGAAGEEENLFAENSDLQDLEPQESDDGDFDLQAEVDDIDLASLDQELGALSASTAVAEAGERLGDAAAADGDLDALGEDLSPQPEALESADELESDQLDLEETDADTFAALDADLEAEFGDESGQQSEPARADASQSDEELFSAALADLPTPEDVLAPDDDSDDEDGEFDFLADTDEAATKLDLARAYIDMGDHEGAQDILEEVVQEGDEQQRQQAQELMSRLG